VKTTLLIAASALLLASCGSSSTKYTADQRYNTEKPTTFAEYKKWREENDPAAQRYAEYKEWEINFRRWKAQQDK